MQYCRFLLLSMFCLLIGTTCYCQPLSFENYTSSNGISQNSGYAIGQTPEGFIWLGTQNGLNRYDSHEIVTYSNIEGDSNSLSNNFITALLTDDDGVLWIGTRKGVNIYNRYTNSFSSLSRFFHCDNSLDKTDVKKIEKSNDGSIWVVTKDDGLYSFSKNGLKINHYFKSGKEKVLLRGIALDENGQVYLSTEKDILKYNNGAFESMHVKVDEAFKNVLLQEILFYKGTLWIGSLNEGLFTLKIENKDTTKLLQHLDYSKIGGNWGKEITAIKKDRKNNLFIGTTANGLFVINSNNSTISNSIHDPGNNYSLNKNYILSIFEDWQGLIWVGTSGGGFSKYDSKKLLFNKQVFNSPAGLSPSSNMIMSLFNDHDSTYYVGTLAGGMIKTNTDFSKKSYFINNPQNKHSLLHNTIYGFAKDDKGILWLATKTGLCSYNPSLPDAIAFNQYPPENNAPQKFFYSIIKLKNENALLVAGYNGIFKFDLLTKKWATLKDKKGFATKNILNTRYMLEIGSTSHVLICTEGLGLVEYDYKNGVFEEYTSVKKQTSTIRNSLIYEGYLWLATDNGLLKVDTNSKQVISILNKNKALIDNVVYAILPATNHNIWISTNNGLARVNTQKLDCKYFDEGYGLQGMEFNTACSFVTQSGHICFGGINGINIFNPSSIPDKGFVAPTVITSIAVMNNIYKLDSSISYLSTIKLPYDSNFLTISFATLNFSHSEKNNYAYRLIDVDKDWVFSSTQHMASYTQLKPGNYLFEVKGSNSNGQWSEAKKLHIIITPPWWLTWWIKCIYLSLLIIALYYLYYTKTKKIRLEEKLKTQLLEYELKALHAQMNPHFIFNCLASIKQMIIDDDKENANKYLNKFSKLIRQTLDQSRKPFITLAENNEYLTNYIEMEQLRFPGQFSYQIEMSNLVEDDIEIPPIMVQPLIENAIWHGLMPNNKKQGKLLVQYKKEANVLKCIVDDNGVGFSEKSTTSVKHNSYGIESIQKRLDLLKKAHVFDVSLNIIDKQQLDTNNYGTIATLSFEINKNH